MNKKIYHTLRERIVFLTYTPGTILKEQALAEEFGVSRTPLRTVLLRLEWEHLLKILPRTGIQVSELELNTITHVFQARLELESVIGIMAAERFTPSHFTRLEKLKSQCRHLTKHHDPEKLARLDMDLKKLFHDAAGNPFLTEMSDRFYVLTFRLWYFNLMKMDMHGWHKETLCLQSDLQTLTSLLTQKNSDTVGKTRKTQLLEHVKRIRTTFLGLSDT
ncbi:MAG: GntR family transcriptional regulator [Desulfotignum sp.]|nr:GntR family transcriptional regulator [Desulfotignum sp.]MCF8113262.1 GntR family transcriptional regulator [Desulfotignum sp.]MCF8124851.1 GntR family transcriptional regulator [Desulfotignum sp.]